MEYLLGKRVYFTAIRGAVSVARGTLTKVVCITEITHEGTVVKDHAWIPWDHRVSKIPKDKEFSFRATVVKYLSCDDNGKQVMKYGLKKVREVVPITF